MTDTRKGRRKGQIAEAEALGAETDAASEVQAASVRPSTGRPRDAFDAASAAVASNLNTAAKTANAQIAIVDESHRAYVRASEALAAHLEEPCPQGPSEKRKYKYELERLELLHSVARQRATDARMTAASRLAAAMVLIKAGKAAHDAQLGEKVGRMKVTGTETVKSQMLRDPDTAVH